jgi:predicted CoA-binding protein
LSKNEINEIIGKCKVIAIVGLSNDTLKHSFSVAVYLKKHGFRIIPVNPFVKEVLGEKSFKSLLGIPADIRKTIDIVDIFRKSEDVPLIVQQAIELKRSVGCHLTLWMQEGIVNEAGAEAARQAGLVVVMDTCLMKAHMHLGGTKHQRHDSGYYDDG